MVSKKRPTIKRVITRVDEPTFKHMLGVLQDLLGPGDDIEKYIHHEPMPEDDEDDDE